MSKITFKPGNMLYPVPVVMVSCQRQGEKPNIITVAWAGTVCSSPAMLSISIKKERHSYGIIRDTKEFVVNLVTKELTLATDYCGVRSGRDVDKFREMHLTPQESEKVKAPGIEQSPVNIECRVTSMKDLGSHVMFVAEVVNVTVDDAFMDDRKQFHLNAAGLVAYSHGEYFALGKRIGKFGYSVNKSAKSSVARLAGGSVKKKPEKKKPEKKGGSGDRPEKKSERKPHKGTQGSKKPHNSGAHKMLW